ncbi:PH domain-containing protein [Rossellomorea vietnamensis]|uniref:PH domain-containing protein n=1 Tax=Rossellomorea vietnamensis TaxID=218284 RepID=A0A5D4M7T5_9BACI|nr:MULTISPECIES: PH domain-containing protein [Bacillaceae]TYR97989.1 PH domain-containing protein [Rossellomorea vietnamensis]
MVSEPNTRISEKALPVWRWSGLLHSAAVIILAIASVVLAFIYEWQFWIPAAAVAVAIVYTYFFAFLLPVIRWKRWRYEVREQEIELQRGVFFVKRTLVPMVRVQHVDTVQGPLLRKYGLASITISTAATTHEIPALDMYEADDLRNSISSLARVAEDDV